MAIGPNRATRVLLEVFVVEDTKDWLEEKENKKYEADDWMRVVKLCLASVSMFRGRCEPDCTHHFKMHRHVYSQTKCNNVEQISEELHSSMDPHQTWEACDTDQDTAGREEHDKS